MERAELAAKLGASPAKTKGQTPILICESAARKFMAAFADAVASEADVFLCDPNWGAAEKTQLAALLQSATLNPKSKIESGWLMIPTGGTSGQLKFARHDQDTIAAAVNGFTQHFGRRQINACGVLPLHHVSGFMAWMRCALTGGEYRQLDWKAVEQGKLPEVPPKPDGWVISLVPTQLARLLRRPAAADWLQQFGLVLLSGASAQGDLLKRAGAAGIPLVPAYGMTETAAMVTALRPREFSVAAASSGSALPHARVMIADNGTIVVEAASLFRGYYPEWRAPGAFETADLGRLDEKGRLHVLGRRDEAIITGGEKVNPAEVEAVLLAAGGLAEVVVFGLPDAEWGQVVVAAFPAEPEVDLAKLKLVIKSRLAAAKQPKHLVSLTDWPRTSAGKVDRAGVARLAGVKLGKTGQ